MAARQGKPPPAPVRITTAGASRADDIAGRQRRYLLSMGVRTLCVVGAVLVGPTWYRWVLIAGGIFIPYVAVVLANMVNAPDDDGFELTGGLGNHRAITGAPQGDDTP